MGGGDGGGGGGEAENPQSSISVKSYLTVESEMTAVAVLSVPWVWCDSR